MIPAVYRGVRVLRSGGTGQNQVEYHGSWCKKSADTGGFPEGSKRHGCSG